MSTVRPYFPLIVIIIAASLIALLYHKIFGGFFPLSNGNVGNDFSYFLPSLIDGYFWSQNNGAFSTQWFTPGFCGGLPAFANPQSINYSIPQWLTLFVSPLTAVYSTLLIFAVVGFIGCFLLLYKSFRLSFSIAILGGCLFAFNGFYSQHLLVGHLSFHAFMLTPLLAYFLLKASGKNFDKTSLPSHALNISIAAILLAYMIYSAAVILMPAILICIIAIALIHHFMFNSARRFWPYFIAAGIVSSALSAAKLSAAFAFMSNFPREYYPLPGANSLSELFAIIFEGLFIGPRAETTGIVNKSWQLGQQEFDFGISIIPLLLLILSLVLVWQHRSRLIPNIKRYWLSGLALVLLLSIPLVINIYSPSWHELLKQTPLLKNSSNLFRWLAVYIPIVILISCIGFDRLIKQKKLKLIIVLFAIPIAITQHILLDRQYYADQTYSPEAIEQAYNHYSQRGTPPTIQRNKLFVDEQKRIYMPQERNDVLVHSESPMTCYEPLFGYRLEKFPMRPLRPGLINKIYNDHYNFKNPACYVFNEANACQPGEHFRSDQAQQLDNLRHYRPFEFKLPLWQWVSNAISLSTLAILLVLWLSMLVHLGKQKLKNRSNE